MGGLENLSCYKTGKHRKITSHVIILNPHRITTLKNQFDNTRRAANNHTANQPNCRLSPDSTLKTPLVIVILRCCSLFATINLSISNWKIAAIIKTAIFYDICLRPFKKRLPFKTTSCFGHQHQHCNRQVFLQFCGIVRSTPQQSDRYRDTLYSAVSQMESPGTASNGSVTQQSSQHGPPNGGGGGMHGNTTVPGGDDDTPNGWNCSMHPSVFFLLGM